MTTTLVDIQVQYLDDTKEWYARTDQVLGAHAIGNTAQDAVANLSDLLPDLMMLSKRKTSAVSLSLPFHISLPVSYA